MTTILPTRAAIERAEPLEFPERTADRQANIQIQVSPVGLTVVVEYTGAVSSIFAAIERLRAAGVMDVVTHCANAQKTSPAPIATPERKARAERVEPAYQADGTPICPQHRKPLLESQYGGWYCASKAKPGEAQNDRGYCSLKFSE